MVTRSDPQPEVRRQELLYENAAVRVTRYACFAIMLLAGLIFFLWQSSLPDMAATHPVPGQCFSERCE